MSNVTYRWSGTNWIKLTDSDAEEAKALANTKAKIFTATPTPPYNKGDLWVQGTSGDIMRCNTTRTSGSYVTSDWAKASKYTDDTQANNVLNNLTTNYYTKADTDAQIQITADSITNTVSSTYVHKNTAYSLQSQIKQNADNIQSKVSSGEFSTLFNQNAKAFDFTIGSSNGMNVRIDRNGIKVKNGGLQVTNSNGTTIIDGSSNIFKIHTIYEVTLNPGNSLTYNYYINHNLGYVPAYAAFQVASRSSMGTSNTLLPALTVGVEGGYLEFSGIIRCNASSSQIIINYVRASTSVTPNVRVKVFVYKERLI